MAIAFLFPGQGSAEIGMGTELFEKHPLVGKYYARISEILGRDILAIIQDGPEKTLVATENAQPAIFALSAACFDLFGECCPLAADFYAGHSLGELTALYAAGALSFDEAAKLVCKRGEYIAAACDKNPGTMAAVMGLDEAAVEEICEEVSRTDLIVPANYNTPGQIVVSGTEGGIARAGEMAQERRGKFIPLKVSGAFHSPLVTEAGERMKETLREANIESPTGVFIANATGNAASQPDVIRDLLYKQITHPVRWAATLERMVAGGVDAVVEFGHGKVLTGMFKKVKRDARLFNIYDEVSLSTTAEDCRDLAL